MTFCIVEIRICRKLEPQHSAYVRFLQQNPCKQLVFAAIKVAEFATPRSSVTVVSDSAQNFLHSIWLADLSEQDSSMCNSDLSGCKTLGSAANVSFLGNKHNKLWMQPPRKKSLSAKRLPWRNPCLSPPHLKRLRRFMQQKQKQKTILDVSKLIGTFEMEGNLGKRIAKNTLDQFLSARLAVSNWVIKCTGTVCNLELCGKDMS